MTDTILAGLVKPLEWRKTGDVWWRASSEIALYLLTEYRGKQSGSFKLECNEFVLSQYHDTLEAAQAAANADHAARILASIDINKLRALVDASLPTAEHLAYVLWKHDAERAAPNVAKQRTRAAFADQLPATRQHWMGFASAALAALQEPRQ